jgi:hypothetical protein
MGVNMETARFFKQVKILGREKETMRDIDKEIKETEK